MVPLITIARSLPNESVLAVTSVKDLVGLTASGETPGSSSNVPPPVLTCPPLTTTSPSLTSVIFVAAVRVISALVVIVPLDALPVADALASGTDDPDVASALRAAGLASRGAGARFNALSGGARSREVAPQRLRLALLVACASVTLALAAPLVSARLVERAALRAHDKIRKREVSALTTAFELGRVSEALAAVADRDSQRRSSIDLLAHLAALLPSGAALTHLQLDSVGGTLIALAPSADGVLKGISESTLIGAPEIVGPVTRERAGAREVERLTLRFVHRADTQLREQR